MQRSHGIKSKSSTTAAPASTEAEDEDDDEAAAVASRPSLLEREGEHTRRADGGGEAGTAGFLRLFGRFGLALLLTLELGAIALELEDDEDDGARFFEKSTEGKSADDEDDEANVAAEEDFESSPSRFWGMPKAAAARCSDEGMPPDEKTFLSFFLASYIWKCWTYTETQKGYQLV